MRIHAKRWHTGTLPPGFVQMYVVAMGLILGAMNRLPIKLPRRGPGRRHSSGSSSQQTVSFADVAGVDEAKEELSEIVVRTFCLAGPSATPPAFKMAACNGQPYKKHVCASRGQTMCIAFNSSFAHPTDLPCAAYHSCSCCYGIAADP